MKKLILFVVAALAVLLSFFGTALAVNEAEDNNSIEKATKVDVNDDIHGSTSGKDDSDWYSFSLPENGCISIDYSHTNTESKDTFWYIYLYRADGNTPLCGNETVWNVQGNIKEDEVKRVTGQIGLDAGEYYLLITPEAMRSGSAGRYEVSDYTVRINFDQSDNWESEYNDRYSSADEIPLNCSVSASSCNVEDCDYFKFTILETGFISVTFSHNKLQSENTYWRFDLLESDGVEEIGSENSWWSVKGNSDKSTANIGLPAGTYCLKIQSEAMNSGSLDNFDHSTYTIEVVFTAVENWETETNNSFEAACTIPVYTRIYGASVGSSDEDWYRFKLDSAESISVNFSHADNIGNLTYWIFYLYKDDGLTPIPGSSPSGWAVYGNANKDTNFLNAQAGTYYIRVIPEALMPESNGRSSTKPYSIYINVKHDHVFDNWEVLKEPTCIEKGLRSHGCTICEYTETNTIPAKDHSFGNWTVDVEQTCSKVGLRHRICLECGEIEQEEVEMIPHSYGNWIVTKEPTCTEEGFEEHVCSRCKSVETRPLEKVEHIYGKSHRVSGSILKAPIVYSQKCENCDATKTYEEWKYAQVAPFVVNMLKLIFLIVALLLLFIFIKKVVKVSFICPYCFKKQKITDLEFRCVNQHCVDVADLAMTRYCNGNMNIPLNIPLKGKRTFRVYNPKDTESDNFLIKGAVKTYNALRGLVNAFFIPKTALCSKCGKTTDKVICPSCHNPLPKSTLNGEDMIISIVGSRGAGKSHYIGVLIHEFIYRVSSQIANGSFEPFDDTADRYQNFFGTLYGNDKTKLDKTDSSLINTNNGAYRPFIYTLKTVNKGLFGKKTKSYTLAFFDSAGEDLNHKEVMDTVNRYICKSAGIIFIVDPFGFPAIKAKLDENTVKDSSSVGRKSPPEDILVKVSKLIRGDKGLKEKKKIKIPVAVVLSKFDDIVSIIPRGMTILDQSPHCTEKAFDLSDWHNVNTEVKGFLNDCKGNVFLNQLDVNYSDYSCFTASSLGFGNRPDSTGHIDEPRPHRIEDAMLWILSKKKVIKTKK